MTERFNDGERGLEAAINAGAVGEWTVEGQRFCATREVSVGSSHSVAKSTSGKNLTAQQHNMISDAVDCMQLCFQFTGAGQRKAESGEV
eukprot:6572944-Pyramimonas_sp.AAC.1